MSNHDQSEIASFLVSYRSAAFTELFERLKAGYREVEAQRRILADQDEPTFNVFKVLGVSDYEVRTHSAFLKTLLDPEGSHEQGTLFLERFLEYCSNKYSSPAADGSKIQFPNIETPLNPESWKVKVEDPVDQGRFDIVLRSPELLCVIENKIYASEGEDQLRRYWEAMQQEQKNVGYSEIALVFLTLQGDKSETGEGIPYFSLSYRNDIYNWLHSLREDISNSPHLRTVLDQYIQIILELSGVKMVNEDVITQFIRRPENLALILDIEKQIDRYREVRHQAFWELLSESLESRLSESEHSSAYEITSPLLENYRKGWVGCYISKQSGELGRDYPQLSVRIVQGRPQEGNSLYLGVKGGNVDSSHPSKNVQKLVRILGQRGFNTSWWIGHKFLMQGASSDSFLKQMLTNRQPFIQEITNTVWDLFVDIQPILEAANIELRNEGK